MEETLRRPRHQKGVPPRAVAPTALNRRTTASRPIETAAPAATRGVSPAAGASSPSTLTPPTTQWCACQPATESRGSGGTPSAATWWVPTRRATSTAWLCSGRTTSATTGTTGRCRGKQTRLALPWPAGVQRWDWDWEWSCPHHPFPRPPRLCLLRLSCLPPLFHHLHLLPRCPCLHTQAPLPCLHLLLILAPLTFPHPFTRLPPKCLHLLNRPPCKCPCLLTIPPHTCILTLYPTRCLHLLTLLPLRYLLLLFPPRPCLFPPTLPTPACFPLRPTLTCWWMATARPYPAPPPCPAGPPCRPAATPSRSTTTRPCRMRGCYSWGEAGKTTDIISTLEIVLEMTELKEAIQETRLQQVSRDFRFLKNDK